MNKLFIVIVAFNGGETLMGLINNLIKESEVKIVVVENGNKEFRIKNYESRIKIIRNNKNLGFARGCNAGISFALKHNADRVLLLNQDVVIEKKFLEELINNQADIVSPVIKFKRNNSWVYDFGGKIDWNIGRTYHLESTREIMSFRGYSRNLSHMRDYNSNKLRDPSTSVGMTQLDYVSGCAMLVKREVFEKIGLFDEKLFLYFEDVDFCLRAKRAGFSTAVSSELFIIHKLIEGNKRSGFKKYHLLRSNFLFINKYMGRKKILGYLYLLALAVKIMLDRFLHHPRSSLQDKPFTTSEVS